MVLRVLALALVLGVVSVGCGSGDEPVSVTTNLEISLSDPEQSPPRDEAWTLSCDPPGGSLPEPAVACDRIDPAQEVWEALPADAVCTSIYGGPQTMTVRGTIAGRAIDLTYDRSNGCGISRYETVFTVLALPE